MNSQQVTTYKHARREMRVTAAVWVAAFLWTVGYCLARGYRHPPDSLIVSEGPAVTRIGDPPQLLMGIPDWVLIGIVIPWLVCSVFTVAYGLFGMGDDDLGTEAPGDA